VAGKARVHELAKELGVTSKEVLNKLAEQGEYVKSASSTVEAPVARRLRDAYEAKSSKPSAPKPSAPKPKAPAPAAAAAPAAPAEPKPRREPKARRPRSNETAVPGVPAPTPEKLPRAGRRGPPPLPLVIGRGHD